MLYKNHQKVSLNKDPLYVAHKEEFEKLLANHKAKGYVTFTTGEKPRINKTGYKEPARTSNIPVEVTVASLDGFDNDMWIYTTRQPKIEQNGEKTYDKTPIYIETDLQVPIADAEKIFFLLYLSTAGKKGRIKLVDETKEADNKVADLSRATEITYLLTGSTSPVTETTVRRIAKAFGISGVDTKTKAQVVLALKDMIAIADLNHDNFRDSNAFLKALQEDDSVNIRAIVQEALDNGRIAFDELNICYQWKSGDEVVKKVMNIDPLIANNPILRRNALDNYFISNVEQQRTLKKYLAYSVEDVNYNLYSYGSLKTFAANSGVSAKGTKEELVARLEEDYRLNKEIKKYDMSVLIVSELKDKEQE